MIYKQKYRTPAAFDDVILLSDGKVLRGLYFIGSDDEQTLARIAESTQKQNAEQPITDAQDLPIFSETRRWLDIYFSGRQPDFTPAYTICNLTPFRAEVQAIMCQIPFGKTATYGEIAKQIATKWGIKKISAQAVGGAVGSNPICLIVPCHRVLGANGKLTGYGGGLNNKIALLQLEGIM